MPTHDQAERACADDEIVSRFRRRPSRMMPRPQHALDREADARRGPRAHDADVDQDQPEQHRQRDLEADRQRVREDALREQMSREADH